MHTWLFVWEFGWEFNVQLKVSVGRINTIFLPRHFFSHAEKTNYCYTSYVLECFFFIYFYENLLLIEDLKGVDLLYFLVFEVVAFGVHLLSSLGKVKSAG